VDRREQDLADLSGFRGTPDHAAAYYLGGHSWGATTALAYAAWDFNGHPGYRDLSGLVLLDGGVHDAFAGEGDTYRLTTDQAAAWLKRISEGEVFDETFAIGGRAETFPILQQLADWLFSTHALVPDMSFNPAYTSTGTVARALAGPVPAALEWYWPNRLTLDLEAADPFADTAVARQLGLRLWHAREIDVPLYSFASGLTHGTVNTAARWVVTNSRIPSATYAENDAMTHLDTLWSAPGKSTVLQTLTPFLAHLGER
jgi:pimeloyl-ACP methyl ester carboxylesterase